MNHIFVLTTTQLKTRAAQIVPGDILDIRCVCAAQIAPCIGDNIGLFSPGDDTTGELPHVVHIVWYPHDKWLIAAFPDQILRQTDTVVFYCEFN